MACLRNGEMSGRIHFLSVFTNHRQEDYLSFSPRLFVNLNVTQLLISQTIRNSQSEVVLLSNYSK